MVTKRIYLTRISTLFKNTFVSMLFSTVRQPFSLVLHKNAILTFVTNTCFTDSMRWICHSSLKCRRETHFLYQLVLIHQIWSLSWLKDQCFKVPMENHSTTMRWLCNLLCSQIIQRRDKRNKIKILYTSVQIGTNNWCKDLSSKQVENLLNLPFREELQSIREIIRVRVDLNRDRVLG